MLRSITELGPLTDLLARRDVEEIFIEGPRVSYLDGSGRLRGLTVPTSEDENRQVVERMLATTDRQLNTKHPMVQARVLGGSARLTAAIPPIGDQLSATVRRYVVRNVTLADLVARDSLSPQASAFLHLLMQLRSRVTVSGEPGAGKTTLLAALLAAAPTSQCVRACEEIRELAVPITHGSYYEVRPPALDGTGEITLRDLVKFVLAMRPDRIVVGEVRGAEAFELSRAVNAGCGFLCTVHANSASEALDALVNAALMAGENVTERIVRKVFSQALDVVVHLDRDDVAGGLGRDPPARRRDRRGRPRTARRLHHRAVVRARGAAVARCGGRARSRRRWRADSSGWAASACTRSSPKQRAPPGPGRGHGRDARRRTRDRDVLRPAHRSPRGSTRGAASVDAIGSRPGVGAGCGCSRLERRCRRRSSCSVRSASGSWRSRSTYFVTGTALVAVVPACAAAMLPRAYFGRRRVARLRELQRAWPDGLRDVGASLAAGRSLGHALLTLAETGPQPLRDAFARFPTLSRMLGPVAALEVVKAELATPRATA